MKKRRTTAISSSRPGGHQRRDRRSRLHRSLFPLLVMLFAAVPQPAAIRTVPLNPVERARLSFRADYGPGVPIARDAAVSPLASVFSLLEGFSREAERAYRRLAGQRHPARAPSTLPAATVMDPLAATHRNSHPPRYVLHHVYLT